jgi:hypothetical protein
MLAARCRRDGPPLCRPVRDGDASIFVSARSDHNGAAGQQLRRLCGGAQTFVAKAVTQPRDEVSDAKPVAY